MHNNLVLNVHKAPYRLKILMLYCRYHAFAILGFVHDPLSLAHEQLLAQQYPVDTKHRTAQRELRLQTRLETAPVIEKRLGLHWLEQGLEGGCFFWHRNDGRGLRGLSLLLKEVVWSPQRKKISGGKRSGLVDQRGWPQQGEHKDLKRSSLKGILKEVLKQFPQTKWLSAIRKDYGFLSLLGVYFSVSFKLPPLNLLYQIFPIKQIESY